MKIYYVYNWILLHFGYWLPRRSIGSPRPRSLQNCNSMEVKNATSNKNKPPLILDAQKIVSSLNGIWDMMVYFIIEQESPMNNQGMHACRNTDAGTSRKNHEKIQKEMKSEKNLIEITAKNASNVCNTRTIKTENSRDNIKRREINDGTLKDKRCHHRKGKVGVEKSRKLSDTNDTGEVHINTVNLLAENKQVTQVVNTSSKADGKKSECISSLKRKGTTDNVTSKKIRLTEVAAQKIVNNNVSNKENGGGVGVEIDCKIALLFDLSDEIQHLPMNSHNLNNTKEENRSRDIIEISDDEYELGEIDDDTLDKTKIAAQKIVNNYVSNKENGGGVGVEIDCKISEGVDLSDETQHLPMNSNNLNNTEEEKRSRDIIEISDDEYELGEIDDDTLDKTKIAAQKIVNNHVSNKENGGGVGVEIDCKISEGVDLSDETQHLPMNSDNLNNTEEEKRSRDIIEISDDEYELGEINDDTLDKLRSMLKNVSISTNQSIYSLASSTSPLSTSMPEKSSYPVASKPVEPGTSNVSVQEPILSLSHVTKPLNLHLNTVKSSENDQVKKVVTTTSNADWEKSECKPSLKNKGKTDYVTSKKRRLTEVAAQKIVNNYVSNKDNGISDENGGGFGVEIDSKICEVADLSDETHQQAMTSDNLNKPEKENKSRDIIEKDDDVEDSKKPKTKVTTVKVCDVKNKQTNGDIDGDTLDKLPIRNDITIKPARSMLKNVSISTNQYISSQAPSTSPLLTSMPEKSRSPVASKPVEPDTSNISVQAPIVSISHVTTPLNLPILNTEILVAPRSSAHSLTSQKSLAHTSTSKRSPQGSTLSRQQPPKSLLTPGAIIPIQSYSMNLLPSSTRSKIPVFSSPCSVPVADKPSVPPVNQRKYFSALPKLAPRPSQLSTSPVAMHPVPSNTAFNAHRTFAEPSHFNTPLNLPSFRPELSVTSISSLQKPSPQSHIASFRRERTRSNSPAKGSMHPHQPLKTWHTPVTLTLETTSHTTSNTFQVSSPLTFDSTVIAFGERSTPPSSALINPQVTRPALPYSVQRATPVPISRKSRPNFPATPPMLYMLNRPLMPTIPTHSEIVYQARPNLLPGATLDVSMTGIPSFYDPIFSTDQLYIIL